MDMKIGKSNYMRSTLSGRRTYRQANAAKTSSRTHTDTFDMSPCSDSSDDLRNKLKDFTKQVKEAVPIELKSYKPESDTPEGMTKMNFEFLNDLTKPMRENLPSSLEKAGVPKDITFEFEHDINTHTAKITKISDESCREKAESVLNNYKLGLSFTAFSSRVMNGYISSAYYPAIAKNLEACYGQDISDLYIDENGNLCGANDDLKKAIAASKAGKEFLPDPHHKFPAKNIEGIIKRLISDENITPNISYMGYDGESIYTDDGEFKFGKGFDPDLFGKEKYLMRGSVSLLISGGYDRWLENEEKF